MRLPNGFGSVYKLSGKRRNPWAARKTVGWNDKGQPVYKFVGYYRTRQEALTALGEYNADPFDADTVTFAEVFDRWYEEQEPKLTPKNSEAYRRAFALFADLHSLPMAEIKLDHVQRCIDQSGKNTPSLKKPKSLINYMLKYSVVHEIVPPERAAFLAHLDITRPGNPDHRDKRPFTAEEIQYLWDNYEENEYMMVTLILIYTGLRIGELFNLDQTEIHLGERWLSVTKAKTAAGLRDVPIAEKIVPLFEYWMQSDCRTLIHTGINTPMRDSNFRNSYMHRSGLQGHTPHECRHTCISLLAAAGVDQRVIKQIVGHAGADLTESVYTHIDMQTKIDAINLI